VKFLVCLYSVLLAEFGLKTNESSLFITTDFGGASGFYRNWSSCAQIDSKKSDALVGRGLTCHILVKGNAFNLFYNKIRSIKLRVQHFLVGICMEGTLSMSNLKILSSFFCSWTPQLLPKVPSDLF
jgi:hypothetical protein